MLFSSPEFFVFFAAYLGAHLLVPLDPQQSGGDAFDLADLGLERVRFVKIRDLETQPPGGITSGFDLDAVGAIHAQ